MIHADSVKAWEAESNTFRDIIIKQREEIERLRETIVAADREIKRSHADADRLRADLIELTAKEIARLRVDQQT